jgi:mono/diheme cytochrome c family protein
MRVLPWVVLISMLIAVAPAAVAQPEKAAVERGRVLFEQHCATCHGKDGKARTPDLTLLRRRYGAFFTAQAESAIRGTNPAVVHRAPGMIVWGAILRADARVNRAAADARVRDVLAFIESIQQN